MRGNIRVFKEKGLQPWGNVLPINEFKLFTDIDNPILDDGMASNVIATAEKYLEKPIEYLPLSLYRDFSLTKIRSRYEGPAFARRDMLFYLAVAEIVERKGRFVEKLADVIWAFLEQTEWCIPAHYYCSTVAPYSKIPVAYDEATMPVLELYSGSICSVLSIIVYYLKDELDAISPVIVKRIKHEVYLRGVRPFMTCNFGWMAERGFANNWVTNIVQNILMTVAVTVDDMDTRERAVELAMHYLDNFTAYYPEDGSCDEGPDYWDAAPGNLFDALELLEDISGGKLVVYDHPLIKRMGEYLVNFNIHGKTFVSFADANPVIEQYGKMITRFGKKTGSQDMYAFGLFTCANNRDDRYYYASMGYRLLKDLYIPRPKVAEKTDAKPAVWYDGNKIAIFRESSDTSKGFFLAVKGGTNGEGHNHLDVGCVVIYRDGKPIVIDPSFGSYNNEYFGATRYHRWYTKSSYHSIPIVDMVEQMPGRAFTSENEECDLENKTVTMQLQGAYPENAGIVKMQRTCSLADSTVSIIDSVLCDHVADIRFNYLVIDEPKLIDGNAFELGCGTFMEITGEQIAVEVEKVENVLPFEDLPIKSKWGRECLWRVVVKANANEKTIKVTFR